MQAAYNNVFGQGLWTIGGSITRVPGRQIIDVNIFPQDPQGLGRSLDLGCARPARPRSRSSWTASSCCTSRFVLGPQQWPGVDVPRRGHGPLTFYKMTMAVS
jgi:hypothetical protein